MTKRRPTVPPQATGPGDVLRRVVVAAAPFIIITASVFATFGASLRHDFVWDDVANFVENPHWRSLSRANIAWMFRSFLLGPYQPLSWLSLAVDAELWGPGPLGPHVGNLVYHAAAACMVYLLARILLRSPVPDDPARALDGTAIIAALLFALHPLRVESVAWATERRDVLSGLLVFAAVVQYLRAHTGDDAARRRLTAAWGLYVASLLAKATAMGLPLVLLLLDVYPLRRWSAAEAGRGRLRRLLVEKAPFVAAAAVVAVVAWIGQSSAGAPLTLRDFGMAPRLLAASYAVCFYVVRTVVPINLSPLYALPAAADLIEPLYVVCLAAVVATTVASLAWSRRAPWAPLAWLSYLLLLAPVSGLALSGRQIAADRYSYLPGAVFALVAGAGLARLRRRVATGRASPTTWNAAFVAAAACVGLLAAASAAQTLVWRDALSLWRHAVRHDPDSAIARDNLAGAYLEKGDAAAAVPHAEAAASLSPDRVSYQVNLAATYHLAGRYDDAVAAARRAVTLDGDDAQGHYNLGTALLALQQHAAAAEALENAVALSPGDGRMWINLARALAALGENDRAAAAARRAVEAAPADPDVRANAAAVMAALERSP